MTMRGLDDLKFMIPPICQGQIVEVSYAADADRAYMRVFDRSDRSEDLYAVSWDDVSADEYDAWDPANVEPGIDEDLWVKIEVLS